MRKFTERILLSALLSISLAFGAMAQDMEGQFQFNGGGAPYLSDSVNDKDLFVGTSFKLIRSAGIFKMPEKKQIGCMLLFVMVKESSVQGSMALTVKLGAEHCPLPGQDT